jgi:hypothetical protein
VRDVIAVHNVGLGQVVKELADDGVHGVKVCHSDSLSVG